MKEFLGMSKKPHQYDGKELILRNDATLMEAVHCIADGIPPVDGKDEIYTEKARKSLSEEQIQEAKIRLYTHLRSGKISASGYECVPQYLTKDGSEEPLKFPPGSQKTKIHKDLWDFNEIDWERSLLNQLTFSEDEPNEFAVYRGGFLYAVVDTRDLENVYNNVKPSESSAVEPERAIFGGVENVSEQPALPKKQKRHHEHLVWLKDEWEKQKKPDNLAFWNYLRRMQDDIDLIHEIDGDTIRWNSGRKMGKARLNTVLSEFRNPKHHS
jgi:hypothetical protein